MAEQKTFRVNLTWIKHRKEQDDVNCHPLTGSCDHYALVDVFHRANCRNNRDLLRRIELVPQLAGHSQRAEQLFSRMCKNSYFLNMLTPSKHIFLLRIIIHHYTADQNNQVKEQWKKMSEAMLFRLDVY